MSSAPRCSARLAAKAEPVAKTPAPKANRSTNRKPTRAEKLAKALARSEELYDAMWSVPNEEWTTPGFAFFNFFLEEGRILFINNPEYKAMLTGLIAKVEKWADVQARPDFVELLETLRACILVWYK